MAPANPPSTGPLDMLQVLVDDVLVQTGKALRSARQDGGKAGSTNAFIKAKLPETIARFHAALDDIEGDIMRAKSTLSRDLESERAKNAAPTQAQPTPAPSVPQPKAKKLAQSLPVESQTKQPMVIDLDSSPPPTPAPQPALVPDQKDVKPRAPFPDMGLGPSSSAQSTPMVKEESTSSLNLKRSDSPPKKDIKTDSTSETTAPTAPMAPMPTMDVDMSSSHNGTGEAPAAQMTDDDLNFTDMQFSLAPPASDLQPPGVEGGGANDMMSLDSMFPVDAKGNNGNGEKGQQQSGDGFQEAAEDPRDGMDFDFGLGDDEFNSYMETRDDNLDMGNSDFNASFFNLDGTDES